MKGSSQSKPCAETGPYPSSPIASVEITAHIDGIALRYEGRIIEVADSMADAMVARRAALSALTMLSACLARA